MAVERSSFMAVHPANGCRRRLTPAFAGLILGGFIFITQVWSKDLANSSSARKRARQAVKRRGRNASERSRTRTAIKNVLNLIASGDKEAAQQAYKSAIPVIDRAAGKGLMHANKAARHKSRLNQALRNLA